MRPFYNLRIRFAECETSQNEVARRAGMAPSTMTARMTGQQPFDAWQMDAIAKVLNSSARKTAFCRYPPGTQRLYGEKRSGKDGFL